MKEQPMSRPSLQPAYIMRDQAHDTVRKIMRERRPEAPLVYPSWLAFGLLLVAFNIITITAP
ncbi:MAG: hypothetical protein ACI9DC_003648 [Gammaproteobacteria bacterium]|jgi:hypothetical protein